MQVMTGLAVVGAVPLTAGVVGWITGFCMGLAGPPPQSYPLYPQQAYPREHYAPPGFRPERPWS
jgi:hypothetical protein